MLSQSPTRHEVKPFAPLRSWLRRAVRGAFAAYFTIDPRSLGLCRLGLGALLLYDLLRRVPGLSTWYSNQGLVPNHLREREVGARVRVGAARLYQGWRMFSADVPTGERMMYVDAVTVTGRHVDPFNEVMLRGWEGQ
jgi:hypothetical protein